MEEKISFRFMSENFVPKSLIINPLRGPGNYFLNVKKKPEHSKNFFSFKKKKKKKLTYFCR